MMWSLLVSIPQAVSTIAIVVPELSLLFGDTGVSIPQAVSTIAILLFLLLHTKLIMKVSIPQAVSTIAINEKHERMVSISRSFNTASGKHYCNSRPYKVSIHGA